MKVFVDECVDWRLAREIVGHEVKTAREMGWLTIKNGELLALAASEFGACQDSCRCAKKESDSMSLYMLYP